MIAGALEADTSKNNLFRELDLDPRSLMVFHVPLIPFLLAWTEKILRVASKSVVLRSHSSRSVQMVSIKWASNSKICSSHDRLLYNNLRLNHRLLHNHCRGCRSSESDLCADDYVPFSQVIENNFSKLNAVNFVRVEKIKLYALG